MQRIGEDVLGTLCQQLQLVHANRLEIIIATICRWVIAQYQARFTNTFVHEPESRRRSR